MICYPLSAFFQYDANRNPTDHCKKTANGCNIRRGVVKWSITGKPEWREQLPKIVLSQECPKQKKGEIWQGKIMKQINGIKGDRKQVKVRCGVINYIYCQKDF